MAEYRRPRFYDPNGVKDIIVNALGDMLIDETPFDIDSLLIELTSLEAEDKIILELDDNLCFDEESIAILKSAFDEFKSRFEEYKNDFSELEINYEQIEERLNELSLFLERNSSLKIPKEKSKVRFITLPVGDGKSSLDCDIEGENKKVVFNGTSVQLSAPHGYEFALDMPSPINGRKNVDVLLSELEYIERTLSDNPVISNYTGKHSPYKKEPDCYVKRNVKACTRIQLDTIQDKEGNPVIAVTGIYHKIGQKDQALQDEYAARKKALINMQQDKNYSIDECERLYSDFRKRLIVAKYGKNVSETMAMCRYLIAQEEKNIQR